jgi:alanyl-tRNA synthetase
MKSQDIKQNWLKFFAEKKGHLIVPSASLVPDNPTLLLTNAGMVPFVPYFLGQANPPASRIASIQRCARLGGKDSDLENIGKTPRHLSFFEMLGNFSFGDYFKEEIISWAWELLTEVYGFKKEQLLVSVFAGDQKVGFDEEAFKLWHQKIGLPESQIMKLGRADNFWGPPGGISGPCGPCSEIYYLKSPEAEPLEIWNLVFMQYEQLIDGSLQTLKKPNVDTGAGLERLAAILQNKETVFETDLLAPLIVNLQHFNFDFDHPKSESAFKIMADHLRCSAMLIADGVQPSNLGRGYLLRMLIRRAARFGKLLGVQEPFLYNLVTAEPVQELLQNIHPEITENLSTIQKQLQKEEIAFAETIERGLKKFQEIASKTDKQIDGEQAFDLYATHGFPVELTMDLAAEQDLTVDLDTYQKAKEKHADVSNQGKFAVGFQTKENLAAKIKDLNLPPTEFLGYVSLQEFQEQNKPQENPATVLFSDFETNPREDGHYGLVILDKTFFYGESGGQVADQGWLKTLDNSKSVKVVDVQKIEGVYVHTVKLQQGKGSIHKDDEVTCDYKGFTRQKISQHHTATHLLHAALRKELGEEVKQMGSLVEPGRLRFDFSHSKTLTPEQISKIDDAINKLIQEEIKVKTEELSYEKAIEKGALAFFDDKYGDKVRVLTVQAPELEFESIELCGGTHVKNTSEIIGFKIVSESAISSGVRRIEAVAGGAYLQYLADNDKILTKIKDKLKAPREELIGRIESLQESSKQKDKELKNLQKQLTSYQAADLLNQVEEKSGIKLLVAETSIQNLREALDLISNKLRENYLLFLVNNNGQALTYAAKVSKDLQAKFAAKDLVGAFAQSTDGSGGGKAEYAQGGGGKPAKLKAGLEAVQAMI